MHAHSFPGDFLGGSFFLEFKVTVKLQLLICFEDPRKETTNAKMSGQELSFNQTFCRSPLELNEEAAGSDSGGEDNVPLL